MITESLYNSLARWRFFVPLAVFVNWEKDQFLFFFFFRIFFDFKIHQFDFPIFELTKWKLHHWIRPNQQIRQQTFVLIEFCVCVWFGNCVWNWVRTGLLKIGWISIFDRQHQQKLNWNLAVFVCFSVCSMV